ncbi:MULTISPECIES: tripartite tricarboxylate transporter TctB family protein [unclassified Polaromonas]|jgi:putative tricarboxylic transport membrane protein|uniref:tripartite tricarboxylate transporter TctB family protein n=1 Tax=unclassified Polaromonas TaxID=2638319 RepID=UPI000BCF16A2|nr:MULTISPECIES: tripartite tricarboxylate transporter TctB family protein [unclassified Polaromonas]OYY37777.1 MAG: tripartite tricarboxylate transporter TctB [Polaromonas sp. 35-63-35]OYZ17949.1 MAG: tripartite tricarboxylate transporter TctB [Polaromonas sp. 16-63-31]OYZ79328.1 MAG: tripartite tricarboxylate transporter TctB [Polaromonas sp. 24-63-21]OZA50471.1 MAG: tripartite tricarboxylate transporter TctB [Polaromonas sp. 17-63-33]OZA86219.1 MAG: tripartite tricarboxylate transporter Tct
MTQATPSPAQIRLQTVVGAGIVLLALGLAGGAVSIPSAAGYGGVGPNFLPWLMSAALLVCGAFIVWEARTGGFRSLDEPGGAAHGDWVGFAWVSAGLLANAALITTIGFIFSCTLCFVLAVQGLRGAEGKADRRPVAWLKDVGIGVAISAPVYWTFTQFLAINLPGLTSTGWL